MSIGERGIITLKNELIEGSKYSETLLPPLETIEVKLKRDAGRRGRKLIRMKPPREVYDLGVGQR